MLGKIERSLLIIDSAIRNGQFLYAFRETNKLLSDLGKKTLTAGDNTQDLMSSLKRTSLFLRPMVDAYSQNQCSLGIIRRKICKKEQTKSP